MLSKDSKKRLENIFSEAMFAGGVIAVVPVFAGMMLISHASDITNPVAQFIILATGFFGPAVVYLLSSKIAATGFQRRLSSSLRTQPVTP